MSINWRSWMRRDCQSCGEFDVFVDGLCFECLWAATVPSDIEDPR